MATPETVKPLVDRILSHPLHFKMSSSGEEKLEKDRKAMSMSNGVPYIVIGRVDQPNNNDGGRQVTSAEGLEGIPRAAKKRKSIPQSLEEALSIYTKGENHFSSGASDSNDDDDGNPSGNEEVYHETKEFLTSADIERQEEEEGEDLGEDLGEELGESLGVFEEGTDLNGQETSEDEEDQDFEDQSGSASEAEDNDDDVDEDEDEECEGSDDDVISEEEKSQLQEEVQEANLKGDAEVQSEEPFTAPEHNLQDSELTAFYQFNEERNDIGCIKGSRIIKNWGPYLSNLKPKGLLNHGVTCYTNAAVQAMVHIPAVQHYLFDILRGRHSDKISAGSVSYVLAEITKKMWSPVDKSKKKHQAVQYINPKKLIARLDDINCMMGVWQQEDSHEYFMSLMSRMQEDSVPKNQKLTESILYDIFGGVLEQVVICKSCGGVSKTEQPFYDLSLHLRAKRKVNGGAENAQDSNGDSQPSSQHQARQKQQQGSQLHSQEEQSSRRFSIEKSISDFFSPELIKVDKEQRGYVCERCYKTTNAIKHNSILRAPETLLIHLKKFRFNGTSSSKMKQAVSYPMFLDLTEYCVKNKDILPLKYQLITVVVHEGRSLSSGHYIVHCKQPQGHWATYDDEYINNISEREVLREPNAYYLIYTRLTPRQVSLRSSPIAAEDMNIPDQSYVPSTTVSPKGSKHASNKKWKNKRRRLNQ